MSEQLRIELLGGCTIRYHNQVITTFKSRKSEALLAYLAHQQRPFSRVELAQIFWEGSDPQQAAANLRKTLSELRQHVGAFLTITHDEVALNRTTGYWLDTAVFTDLIKQGQSAATCTERNWQTPVPLSPLEQAIALYHGDFLAGFYLRDSLAFDEWASLERERLFLAATDVLRALVAHALHHGNYAAGIRHAAHWLALDPLQETAHRQMMRLQARQGQRNAALSQYEQCRDILAAELGVEPTAATTMTRARIRADRPSAIPASLTSFVGRTAELACLNAQLDTPGARLITLTGMGGVGKTRLALQLASIQQTEFRDGVYFIPLAGVNRRTLLATINTHLAIRGSDHLTPQQQLRNYLRAKELLLILDNFEHLVDAARLLLTILHDAPAVCILVTSRVRLNLAEEVTLHLQGLPVPDQGSPRVLETSTAVQLFQARAIQVRPTFALTPVNETAVLHICRLVEGVPLGLELAAAAMRAFTPAQIATHIQQNLDFLDTHARGRPLRHRSMRAVFDYSWDLLSAQEQSIMMRLAVFRDSFSGAAAAVVAQADQASLLTLAQKSLLAAGENGRFHIHELVRQYACEKLTQSPIASATQECHAHYCATLLKQQLTLMRGARQKEALDAIQQEFANIEAAWDWAATGQHAILLDQMLEPLYWFYHVNGRYHDGLHQFQQTAVALAAVDDTAVQLIYARLRIRQATFACGLARYDEAEQALHEATPIVTRYNQPIENGMILHQRGRLAQARSQYTDAISFYEQSLACLQMVDDPFRRSAVLLDLGNTYLYLNQLDQAEQYLQQSLTLQTASDDQAGHAKTLNSLAAIANERGDYAMAQAQYRQSLDLRRQLGDKAGIANLLNNLGNMACTWQKWDEAIHYFQESLAIKHEIGAPMSIATTLLNLGTVHQEQGAFIMAEELYQESLGISQQIDDQLGIVYSLSNLADLALWQQQYTAAGSRWQQALTLAYQLQATDRIFYCLLGMARLWMKTSSDPTRRSLVNDILYGLLAEPDCPAEMQAEARRVLDQSDNMAQPWSPTRSLHDIATALVQEMIDLS